MTADARIAVSALEAVEIRGYRDQWAAAPPSLARRYGIAQTSAAGVHCTAVAALAELRLLHHAIGLHAQPAPALDAVERFYARARMRALVAVADGAPAEAMLRERGYRAEYAWVKFIRDAAPARAVACDLAIRPVARRDGLAMGRVLAAAFELPPAFAAWFAALPGRPGWTCLGAYDGDRLVGTGSLYAHAGAGWVTWAATDPAHRGRNAQKALLAARIDLARERGLRRLVVETGERASGRPDASHRNILAAGFQPAFRRPFWRAPER